MRLRGFVQLNVRGESLERRGAKNFPLEVWLIGKKMLLFPFTLGKAPRRAFIQENVFSMNMLQFLRLLLHPQQAFGYAKYLEHHVERREIGNSKW